MEREPYFVAAFRRIGQAGVECVDFAFCQHLGEDAGLLAEENRQMTVYRSKNWEKAQKKVMSNYDGETYLIGKSKEPLRFVKYDRSAKEIVAVAENNRPVYISKEAVKDFDICEKREIDVSPGEKLMLRSTQKHKDGNFTNGEIVTAKGFDGMGRVITTDGRTIDIQQYDYAYSSTSHKSQGTTVDKVIIGFDRESIKVADQKLAYVATTRGVHEIEIFCENKLALHDIENRPGNRKSAIETDGNPYSELYQKREFAENGRVKERISKINEALEETTAKGKTKSFVESLAATSKGEKQEIVHEEKAGESIKQNMR